MLTSKTYNCCFLGFFLGLISTGLSSSTLSGGESVPSPGDDVAEMVVEPPELCAPPLPLDGGDGGELGVATLNVVKRGFRFFAAFPVLLQNNNYKNYIEIKYGFLVDMKK